MRKSEKQLVQDRQHAEPDVSNEVLDERDGTSRQELLEFPMDTRIADSAELHDHALEGTSWEDQNIRQLDMNLLEHLLADWDAQWCKKPEAGDDVESTIETDTWSFDSSEF